MSYALGSTWTHFLCMGALTSLCNHGRPGYLLPPELSDHSVRFFEVQPGGDHGTSP